MTENSSESRKYWPHTPLHHLTSGSVYIITAATIYKQHFFRSPEKLTILEQKLLSMASHSKWDLEAWAIFSNHYHFIARGYEDSMPLDRMINQLHSTTAREINEMEGLSGRRVWYNFWDTRLTYQKSYLARLNYVHQNAVKHGLVDVARNYKWCSAAWFEKNATRSQVSTIYGFKIDEVNVYDDF
ncbi:MAG: transposase [Acidobacteria bacterium]|nr:transposase [Acidobacteriota bacterium]